MLYKQHRNDEVIDTVGMFYSKKIQGLLMTMIIGMAKGEKKRGLRWKEKIGVTHGK